MRTGEFVSVVAGFQGEEGIDVVEDRAVGGDGEGVLGPGAGLFSLVELQGLAGEEIVDRGPVAVGDGSRFEETLEGGDGGALEGFGVGERQVELAVDFLEEPAQVPGLEVIRLRVGRRRGGDRGPLLDAPAVLLEIGPVGVGDEGAEERLGSPAGP